MSKLDAALSWAREGFHVFPCLPGSKEPACQWKAAATTNPDTIRAWWAANPDYNVGCWPAKNGHAVIDLDPPVGQQSLEVAAIEEGGVIPPTYTVKTPRGGLHLWYRGSVPPTVSKLGEKIDTRGEGSYVLLPPSATADGGYSVECPEDVAELPEWITRRLNAFAARSEVGARTDLELDLPVNVERAASYLKNCVASGKVSVEGSGGDATLYEVTNSVLDFGLSDEQAFALLRDHFNPHCIPPWDEDDIAAKIDHANKYRQNEVGAYATRAASEQFKSFLEQRAKNPPELTDHEKRFVPITLTEWRNRPAPQWLLPGLLPERGIGVIYGASGTYKSMIVLDLAMSLAAGIEVLDQTPVDAVPVLYICGEQPDSFARKHTEAWFHGRGRHDQERLRILGELPRGDDIGDWKALVTALHRTNYLPKLVVIDTLTRSLGSLDEMNARDMNLYRDRMDFLRDALGCFVLLVRHTGKEVERGSRGPQIIEQASDFVGAVERPDGLHIASLKATRVRLASEPEDPWYYQAVPSDPSIFMRRVTKHDFIAIKMRGDLTSPSNVGAALHRLGAVGVNRQKWVTTAVLAAELSAGHSGVDIRKLENALFKAATKGEKPLAAYYIDEAALWSRPGVPESRS